MLTAPARVEPKISPKAGAAELGRERLARLNGCHNLILSNTTFRKPLQGMWVQPNHMPVETPAGGDSSSGRANLKRYRAAAERSGAASRRSAARCAYAKLCLDCSKGKALGLASSRVQQPHESLVAAR